MPFFIFIHRWHCLSVANSISSVKVTRTVELVTAVQKVRDLSYSKWWHLVRKSTESRLFAENNLSPDKLRSNNVRLDGVKNRQILLSGFQNFKGRG